MHTMLKKSLENRPFSKNDFYEHPVLDSYTYVLAQCHEIEAWQSEVVVPQELEVASPLAPAAFGQLWQQLEAHTRALSWHEVAEGQPQEAFASDGGFFEVACLGQVEVQQ